MLQPTPPTTSSPPMQHTRQPISSPTGGKDVPQLPPTVPRPDASPPFMSDLVAGTDRSPAVGRSVPSAAALKGRHGSVRRNIDQQSNTFAFPLASVTSPPASRLLGGVSPLLSLTEENLLARGSGQMSAAHLMPQVLDGRAAASASPVPSAGLPSPPPPTITQQLPPVNSVKDALAQARTSQSQAVVAPGGPSMPTPPQQAAQQGARTIFCLFGSLERRISLLEVRDVFNKHRSIIEPFFMEVSRIDQVFPPDINFMELLKNPTHDPKNDEFFSCPMTIWPLTTLYLVGCFLVTARKVGYEALFSALQEGGLLMVGKGVFAALAVAESKTEEELIKNTSRQYRAAFCVGIAYSKKQLEVESLTTGCGGKGFSILVVNIPVNTLQLLIDQANNVRFAGAFTVVFADKGLESMVANDHMAPHSEIQITRVISERSAVVVAHPLDLMRLDMLLVKFADETGIKIHKDFLPTPVPENSPFFNQGLQYELCRIWHDMDFTLEGSDFVIPIFSPQNGGELRVSQNLLMDIASAVTCVPQDLTYSLQNLRDGDVLLDYSPSNMRLGQIIAWTRRDIVCLAEPSDRVEQSILPSPRRSARGDLICKTLGKCAEIQDIMNQFSWDYKPFGARIVQLSTSFITDLHLLIDLDNVQQSNPSHPGAVGASQSDLRSPDMSITSFPMVAAGRSTTNPAGIGSPRALSLLPRVGSMIGGLYSTSSPPFSSQLAHPAAGAFQQPSNPQLSNPQLSNPQLSNSSMHNHHSNQFSSNLIHAGVLSQKFVALPHTVNKRVVNLYEVSPLIKYLEMQHRCVLTRDAVELADRLSKVSGLDFPPHTLLLCPTVLQLLEFWDGLEFLQRLSKAAMARVLDSRDAPPGMVSAAVRRRRQLKRATDLIYGTRGSTSAPPPAATRSASAH